MNMNKQVGLPKKVYNNLNLNEKMSMKNIRQLTLDKNFKKELKFEVSC